MYESCTAQLNEWKSDAKGKVEGERGKKGGRDEENLGRDY
jgi:hypothetical protein